MLIKGTVNVISSDPPLEEIQFVNFAARRLLHKYTFTENP